MTSAWATSPRAVSLQISGETECVARAAEGIRSLPFVLASRASTEAGAVCVSVRGSWDRRAVESATAEAGCTLETIYPVSRCGEEEASRGPWGAPGSLDVAVVSMGERIKIRDHLVAGKFTVIDVSAPWCGPCHVLAGELGAYMRDHDDVATRMIDLDAPNALASFSLPVARQHLAFVEALPFVRLYGPTGKMLYEGSVLADAIAVMERVR